MPRIQDIGAFNAVRESGLAKLLPAIPRITVGMGTCGRGNGAEEVFHALNEAIQRSGQDVLKARALGAQGTYIGRAFLYGLGAMGEAGVTKALEIIHKELDITMAFCGRTQIDTVDKSILLPGSY